MSTSGAAPAQELLRAADLQGMRTNTLVATLGALLGCLPEAPPLTQTEQAEGSESMADTAWPEIDPPALLDTGDEGSDSLPDEPPTADLGPPEPSVDAHLRIVGIAFDPEGTDGAAGSPEWVELLSLGPDPYPLSKLALEARSWPRIDGADFELAGPSVVAQPGERIRIERYASDDELAGARPDGATVSLAFTGSSGLRNSDGAALVFAADGSPDDELCYGEVAPPDPFGHRSMWTGACVVAAAGALCRADPNQDLDQAPDWIHCDASAAKRRPRR